jgi:hypothetical protein
MMTIDGLGLIGYAKRGAYRLQEQFPAIVFTSGRRTPTDQARAMAQNIVKSGRRTWIADTYKVTPVSLACQRWINGNPAARTAPQIEAGLLAVFAMIGDDELLKLSQHFSGRAFDILPQCVPLEELQPAIEALPGFEKFLTREGGLIRWHVQFHDEPRTMVA